MHIHMESWLRLIKDYVLLKIITGSNYLFLDPIFITLH